MKINTAYLSEVIDHLLTTAAIENGKHCNNKETFDLTWDHTILSIQRIILAVSENKELWYNVGRKHNTKNQR